MKPILEKSDDTRRWTSEHIRRSIEGLSQLGRAACQQCGGGPSTHLIGTCVVCDRCAHHWRHLDRAARRHWAIR